MSKCYSDSDFRDAFLDGAARAFFVSSYADYVEETYADDFDDDFEYAEPGPGGDWYDYAPETPPNAYALAGQLWEGLYHLNDVGGPYTLANNAEAADGQPIDAEKFGRDLAMQAMGHGVSWFDDHAHFPMKVPNIECSFFSFDRRAYRGE